MFSLTSNRNIYFRRDYSHVSNRVEYLITFTILPFQLLYVFKNGVEYVITFTILPSQLLYVFKNGVEYVITFTIFAFILKPLRVSIGSGTRAKLTRNRNIWDYSAVSNGVEYIITFTILPFQLLYVFKNKFNWQNYIVYSLVERYFICFQTFTHEME